MSKLSDFLGENVITRFLEFYASEDEGVIIACCLGVEEGVDMWFPDDSTKFDPRFFI